VLDESEVQFKDFTVKRERIVFAVDPDRFECVPALMPDALQDVVGKFRGDEFTESLKKRDMERIMKGIRDIFGIFLLDDDHYDRFVARLSNRQNPIDIQQLVAIIGWVIERYTNRPTVPSSSSSDGSQPDDGGTSSTDGALATGSTLLPSILETS
jgi:hypothetical protein